MSKRRAPYRDFPSESFDLKPCLQCGVLIEPRQDDLIRPSHYAEHKFCGIKCRDLHYALKVAEKRKPLKHPTTVDIAWAAGIYEGEGYCRQWKQSVSVVVGQKDPQMLGWLKDLFGGYTYQSKSRPNENFWKVDGILARGFLMTIYKFLTDRRKLQVRHALGGEAAV